MFFGFIYDGDNIGEDTDVLQESSLNKEQGTLVLSWSTFGCDGRYGM